MQSAPRFAYVDGLRAVAALLVVWTHGAEVFKDLAPVIGNRWMADLLQTVDLGRVGVVAFFGISGFVIPASFNPHDPRAARTFVVRRFFRLYPAFWLSVLAGVALIWAPQGDAVDARTLLSNLTMLPGALGAKPVIGLYWTLAYELAFYGLCLALWFAGLLQRPLTMAVLSMTGLALTCGLLVASFAFHVAAFGTWGVTLFGMSAMFLGGWWRRRADGEVTGRWERAALAATLLGVLVLLPAVSAVLLLWKHIGVGFFDTVPVNYCGGLALFLAMTSFAKVSWRPLAWVGLVSYALYLFHPVVLHPLARWLGTLHLARLDLALALPGLAAASIAVAAAVFYALERPSIALGRRLSRTATNEA